MCSILIDKAYFMLKPKNAQNILIYQLWGVPPSHPVSNYLNIFMFTPLDSLPKAKA